MTKLDLSKVRRELGLVPPEETYFNLLGQVSSRSNSSERKQGAVIVKCDSVIATACFDAYEKKIDDRIVGAGAIENAISSCAKNGISTDKATLFVYSFPNDIVCKLLAKAGISEIWYIKDTGDSLGKEFCQKAGIKLNQFKRTT